MEFKTLGINGGNGVILHPFRKSLLGNIEPRSVFHTPEDIQWKLNFKVAQDKTFVEYSKKQVQVIIGAPDCGHSSVLAYSRSKKLSNPKDNLSFNLYIDSIKYYQPLMFMMENLSKTLDNFTKEEFQVLFRNYRLIKLIHPVSYWGNSQISRVRLVLIGIHRDMPETIDDLFEDGPDIGELKTADELIKGLQSINESLCNVRETGETFISLYYKDKRRITADEAQKLWLTEFRGNRHWPVNSERMTNQPGVYLNRVGDHPLTVRKQNRQFNHRGLMLTPREMARIQGVPDTFKLWYDTKYHGYSINKARVTIAKSPPYEIGQWFHDILQKIDI